jgi:Tfp pilus assembly protein PilF
MTRLPELAGGRVLLVLAALGLLTFGWSASHAELLDFDDNLFFGPDNPEFARAYRDAGWTSLLDPRCTIADAYLPVSHVSLYFDYWAMRALGCGSGAAHWHSLLLHVLAAFALARLLGRLGQAVLPAAAAAAVFLVHPALVESVAWVSGRKDVLSGLFAFLCLSAVARHAAQPRPGPAWEAGLWALLAVYAKGTAVVLLLLAPLVVAWVRRGSPKSAAAISVAAIAAVAGVHHALVAAGAGTMQPAAFGERLAGVPGASLHYFATLVWPVHLNVLYPEEATLAAFRAAAGTGALVLLGVAAAAALAWRWRPHVTLGLAAATVALLPFNTAWPASSIAAADRYLYLAVPWAALALVGLFRTPSRGAALGATAAVACACLAFARARDFASSEALWESSLAADPDNAVARLNLAIAEHGRGGARARELAEAAAEQARLPVHRWRAEQFLRELAVHDGRLDDAAAHAEQACEAARALPAAQQVAAWLRVATLRLARGDGAAAREAVDTASSLAPDDPGVLVYRASLLLIDAADERGRVAADAPAAATARTLVDRALATAPDLYEGHLVRAQWAQAQGELLAAVKHFRRARGIAPARPDSYLGEADLLLATQDFEAAEGIARAGIAAGADDPALLVRLGLALSGQGKLADARDYYESYLRTRPSDAAVQRSLAAVVATQTRQNLYQLAPAALDAAAERVAALDPANGHAFLFRGLAQRLRRDLDGAKSWLARALAAMPDDEDARRLLAETHRDRGYRLLAAGDPPDAALDEFRAFVDLQAAGVDTTSATDILRVHWQRCEEEGVRAFEAKDFARAEAAFRRCLFLLPEETSARFQLGLAIVSQGGDRLAEALDCFERAERAQRAQGRDASMPVLYQVLTLQRLGRAEEAAERGARFLAQPGDARADVLDRIRVAVGGD